MKRKTPLADDLAALARSRRSALGEPPSAEQLIAYRDGELPEAEAERIRDWLSVDPELAAVYLDLKRSPDFEPQQTGTAGDTDVDDAWNRLSAKLEPPVATEPPQETGANSGTGNVVPLFQRRSTQTLMALAASMVVAMGLLWLVTERDLEDLSADKYQGIVIEKELLRGPVRPIYIRHGVEVLGLLIDASDFQPGGVVAELRESPGRVVQRKELSVKAGQSQLVFRVASKSLVESKSYGLEVRRDGAPPDEAPLLDVLLIPIFEPPAADPPPQDPPADFCNDLDADIDRAVELRKEGSRSEAERLYLDVLRSASADRCDLQVARIENGLGVLATLDSRFVDGIQHFEQAEAALAAASQVLAVTADFASRQGQLAATIEHNRGATYLRLGRPDEALDALRRAEALYRLHGGTPEDWALLLMQSARCHRLLSNPQAARDAVRLAFEQLGATEAAKTRAALWQELARLDLEANRFDDAEQALDRAHGALTELDDPSAVANVVVDRAELAMQQEQWSQCLQQAREALHLAATTPDLNLEAHARYLQSMALSRLGDPEGAKRAAESGLALLEALRDSWQDLSPDFFALRQKYYRHQLDLAAENPADAWAAFERYRARGLLESSARRSADGASDAPDPSELFLLRKQLLDAVWELDGLEPEAEGTALAAHRQAAFRQRRQDLLELQTRRRLAAGQRPLAAIAEPATAADMLDADTLAVSYALGGEGIHVLTLDRQQGLDRRTLQASPEQIEWLITKAVKGLRPNARDEDARGLGRNLADLSRILLGPLDSRLDGFSRLAIVADGPLEGLPFEALRHPRTGRLLVASHEMAYLPSWSVLGASRARSESCSPPESGLFAVGDPIFGSRDERWPDADTDPRSEDGTFIWRRLPATAEEVEKIAALYWQKPAVAIGRGATRDRFLAEAPEHRVLHVASHAQTDPRVPERSRVLLSCIDSEGKVQKPCDLYFEDVASLDLCGQLVVLSACATAGGPRAAGEGVLGLPRAFLLAGASTVVASLWQVADQPTAELMTSFHRHVPSGSGPAAALRQAKLELIEAGRPPADWAAFVALGDWRTIGLQPSPDDRVQPIE